MPGVQSIDFRLWALPNLYLLLIRLFLGYHSSYTVKNWAIRIFVPFPLNAFCQISYPLGASDLSHRDLSQKLHTSETTSKMLDKAYEVYGFMLWVLKGKPAARLICAL